MLKKKPPKNGIAYICMAIETSCDETSVAVLENGTKILSNIISSQIEIHKAYGGVVPEIASRHHLEDINGVIEEALKVAGKNLQDLDFIGVTKGPGLVGALLIGVATAKALAFALEIPLVGVHHIRGHICANYLTQSDLKPPFLSVIVSGGHTTIADITGYDQYKIMGQTRDDAAGEAFDKVARVLGLGYPGGPLIDRLAREGNPQAIPFKRVYLEPGSYDFSFSGTKTGVLNYINGQKQKGEEINKADVAASFQMAIVEVIVKKAIAAAKAQGRDTVALAGGVAANSMLREKLKQACQENRIHLCYPPLILCTDNGAMIGCAAYYKFMGGEFDDLRLDALPSLSIEHS